MINARGWLVLILAIVLLTAVCRAAEPVRLVVTLTDIGIFLAILGAWLQLWDRHNEFTIKCLVAGGVFLLAGWALT